eukprot:SM000088S23764  [mRNA]  locus=s88:526660:530503:- [translate_table: standard]
MAAASQLASHLAGVCPSCNTLRTDLALARTLLLPASASTWPAARRQTVHLPLRSSAAQSAAGELAAAAEVFTGAPESSSGLRSRPVSRSQQVHHRRCQLLQDDVGPNPLVLEAQARVCTGPTQTRPLDYEKTRDVLALMLKSVKGELPVEERASLAQMGAYFGAMTLRATSFPLATQWSAGERQAMEEAWPALRNSLPKEVLFLADPEGAIMEWDGMLEVGPLFNGRSNPEMRLVGALREVLEGAHLGFEETVALLRDILPLKGAAGEVNDALVAAYLICTRMNRETDRELKAYCMAFEHELGLLPVAHVKSLTHYGEPYDGHTRFFRGTLFSAAVRASYGETCLLHGVDWMPPKGGVTEEQMLQHLGAATNLFPSAAVRLLEDPSVGFAYLSMREARPSLYTLLDMRMHIKKRPPFATTEKVQRLVTASGRESMIAGFYHEGYEHPLLMLIRRQKIDAGLVVKGEEGGLSFMTKSNSPTSSVKGRPVNYCSGFRPLVIPGEETDEGFHRESFTMEVNASSYGFDDTPTPRTDRSVSKNVDMGMAALRGERGPVYDRIVFNAGLTDHLLGCDGAQDPMVAFKRAREAIDSGRALATLEAYVNRSREIASAN